jgi:hypothetical protein
MTARGVSNVTAISSSNSRACQLRCRVDHTRVPATLLVRVQSGMCTSCSAARRPPSEPADRPPSIAPSSVALCSATSTLSATMAALRPRVPRGLRALTSPARSSKRQLRVGRRDDTNRALTALATRRMLKSSRSCHTAPLHVARREALRVDAPRASTRRQTRFTTLASSLATLCVTQRDAAPVAGTLSPARRNTSSAS